MYTNGKLEFGCLECQKPVGFSLTEINQGPLVCQECNKKYSFNKDLLRQLKKFEALSRSIREAEEILGGCSVGVDVGGHQVKVPYKLLLTRFTSSLELKVGDRVLNISFRFEPLKEI